MAHQLPPSGGNRSASHGYVREKARKMTRRAVFLTLFKAFELLGLALRVLNELKDLLGG